MEAPFSKTLADLIFEQAERYGDRPAAIWDDRVLSYAELCERAARVAASLRQQGVQRGDRVGLLVNNRPEWLEAFFGTMIAGGIVVAFSTWSTPDELDWLMQDSGVRTLIALERFGDNDFQAALRRLVPEAEAGGDWQSARYPALRDIRLLGERGADGGFSYASLLSGAPMRRSAPGIGPNTADDAIIIYTSGSSSRPKSVPLSHGGIIENGFNIGARQGFGPDDRVLLAPPLFWSYGSANGMSAVLSHGAALVLQGRFEPGEALFHEGDTPVFLFLVASGVVEITKTGAAGTHVVHRMSPGESLGAIGLITGSPYSATAKALTPVKLFRMDKASVAAAIAAAPHLEAGLEALAEQGRAALARDAAVDQHQHSERPEELRSRLRSFLRVLASG